MQKHYRTYPPLAMDVVTQAFSEADHGTRQPIDFGKGVSSFNPFAYLDMHVLRTDLARCTGYGEINGLWSFRQAIARYYQETFHYDLSPARICITNGASGALSIAFTMLLQTGSEIILSAAYYPAYRVLAQMFGARCRFVPLNTRNAIDVERLPELITPNTRAILVNSPSNPYGAVSTADEIAYMTSLGVPVIFDEVYQSLSLNDDPIPSAITHADQHIIVSSFSKSLAIAGFRVGYIIVPESQIEQVTNVKAVVSMSTSLPSQLVAEQLFQQRDLLWREHRRMLQRNWQLFRRTAQRLGLRLRTHPAAGFFAMVNMTDVAQDSMTVALELVRHAALNSVPGIDFSEDDPHFLRLNFACPTDHIEPGLQRLATYLYGESPTIWRFDPRALAYEHGYRSLALVSTI